MRHASRCMLMGLLVAGAAWASAAMAATTTLKDISYDALPGGRVELHMDFGNGPVPQPKIFTTGNPPRIAIDFADTDNAARAPSGYRQGLHLGRLGGLGRRAHPGGGRADARVQPTARGSRATAWC